MTTQDAVEMQRLIARRSAAEVKRALLATLDARLVGGDQVDVVTVLGRMLAVVDRAHEVREGRHATLLD